MSRFRGPPGRFGRFGDAGANPPVMASSAPPPPGALAPLPGQMAPNTLPQSPEMDFFDPQRDGADVMFYTTTVASIASQATANSQIQIDSGVDFYWFASTYQTDLNNGLYTESNFVIPLMTILINDTGSRKNLMNQAFPLAQLAGPGERPYRLVRPRLFRASSTVQFTWFNYSTSTSGGTTATYTNLYFTLHGYTLPRAS